MPDANDLALAAMFFAAALLYSTVGHGGSSAYQAVMAVFELPSGLAKPTALSLNVLVSSLSGAKFARAGHFSWPLFWPFAVASVPAAFVGGKIHLPGEFYRPLLGLVLFASAARLWLGPWLERAGEPRPPNRWLSLVVGAIIGLLSGLTAVGGGIFLTPLVLLAGWADAKRAAAVSAAFILVNSIAGLVGQFVGGFDRAFFDKLSQPATLAFWAVAVLTGGYVGSHLGSRRFDNMTLRRILAIVLVVAGVHLLRQKPKPTQAPEPAEQVSGVRNQSSSLTSMDSILVLPHGDDRAGDNHA
jgi:uncharacterized membrane protein YfcA